MKKIYKASIFLVLFFVLFVLSWIFILYYRGNPQRNTEFLDFINNTCVLFSFIVPILFVGVLVVLMFRLHEISKFQRVFLIILTLLLLFVSNRITNYLESGYIKDSDFVITQKEQSNDTYYIYVNFVFEDKIITKVRCSKKYYELLEVGKTYHLMFEAYKNRKHKYTHYLRYAEEPL